MLEVLRSRAKIVIFFVAFFFIVGMAIIGVGDVFGRKNVYVGKIAGKKIKYQEYYKMFQEEIQNYSQQNPNSELDEATLKRINDQTWQKLVQRTIFDREIKRNHIKVTDEDVVDKLKNDPPEMVKNADIFKTNGMFDKQKYLKALTTNEPVDMSWLEEYFRSNLPYMKLYDKIKADTTITLEQVKKDYKENNDKINCQLIYFDPAKITDATVTEAEIKADYEKNKAEKYEKGPARKFKYVRFKLKPSANDDGEAKIQADEVFKMATSGTDFASLAKDYSADKSNADRGGDLGYFTRGRMVKTFEDAVFSAAVGSITTPVKTDFGYHIIKVEDKRKNDKGEEEVKASHILIKVEPSEATKEALRQDADRLYLVAEDKGLEAAAKEMNFALEETPEFYEDRDYIPGIGMDKKLLKFAFEKKVGALHEPVKNNNDYLVAEISFVIGKHFEDFESVKPRIENTLKREKQKQAIKKQAETFYAGVQDGKYVDVAKIAGWDVIELKDVTVNKPMQKVGKDENFLKMLFATTIGQYTKLASGERGTYMALVDEHILPDMQAFELSKDQLMKDAQDKSQNTYYSNWYQKKLKEAKVEDNRYEFF